jgi:ADP-ribose pyrophosphatase
VAVLALDAEGFAYLVRTFRYAVGKECVEVVQGMVDEGEQAQEAARRELREELGIEAAHWKELGRLYEIPSIMNSPVELFFAHGVEHVEAEADGIETIELVRIPQEVAVAAAASGKINDAVTVAGLLRYGVAAGIVTIAAAEAAF